MKRDKRVFMCVYRRAEITKHEHEIWSVVISIEISRDSLRRDFSKLNFQER